MPRRSAGLLVYRNRAGDDLEVLLVHPGGPLWARRDTGWWSIPKGEIGRGEDAYGAARREFEEELGIPAPRGPAAALGAIVQAGGKRVEAWAVAGDVDLSLLSPGTFALEWPPRSGTRRVIPEIDRAEWCSLPDARRKLLVAQNVFLTRLAAVLAEDGDGGPGTATGPGKGGPGH
ncbi:MAG: NUDIX domain-containing protein [Acidimicrobiales bacterium]